MYQVGGVEMRIVIVGSFGSQGDPQYRLHQPAAALAALPGVEVFEETLIKSRSSLQGGLNLIHETAARDDSASLPL
jgi:hypothetical protein